MFNDHHVTKRQPATLCPEFRLTTAEAARRFDQPCRTLLEWCQRVPGLAERVSGPVQRRGFRWLIDPPTLGLLLAHRLDVEATAARFGVDADILRSYDPAHLGMLLAVLPLAPTPDERKRRPSPRISAAEVGHATP